MEPFHLNYGELHADLQDLIISFTYKNIHSVSFLNDVALVTFCNSKLLPVPALWKRVISYTEHGTRFEWSSFVQTNKNPYAIQSLISLSNVRETVRRLNWNYLKSQSNLAAHVISSITKKKLLNSLRGWSPYTIKLIYHIQRLLTCLDFPSAKIRSCSFEYGRFIIMNPNPLSMYVHSPEIFIF